MGGLGLPAGSCDTHMHVYDSSYPASSRATLFPPDATIEQYVTVQQQVGCERVVVVQPSTYGLDNSCQLAALATLGDRGRGVMVIDADTSAAEIERLHGLGVRGARFHMLPGGAVGWDNLVPVAEAIAGYGWHIQLQMNGLELADRRRELRDLPVDVVVDHVGRFMPPAGTEHPGFVALLSLLEAGNCWVKLSAPYESSPDGAPNFDAIGELVDTLVDQYPDRMLWATNWPHPGQAEPPGPADLLRLLLRWLPTTALRQQVLVTNPARLYGFTEPRHAPETGNSRA